MDSNPNSSNDWVHVPVRVDSRAITMTEPGEAEQQRQMENDGEEHPPSQRRRVVNRTELEQFVRNQIIELFQGAPGHKCPAKESPRAIASLGPLLSCRAVLLHVMGFLAPHEIQNMLSTCRHFYQLRNESTLQELWLESIIGTFSIWKCHADMVFGHPNTRQRWMLFFSWLDRTMPSRDRVQRALFAEQTILLAVDGRLPLAFRIVGMEGTDASDGDSIEWAAPPRADEDEPILPRPELVRDPPHGFNVLHGDIEWSPFCEHLKEVNLTAYDLVLQASDGCGGYLDLYLTDHCRWYRYLDAYEDANAQTTPHSSLGDLICNAIYIWVDHEQPHLDHQLCALAWLVTHRFRPFSEEGAGGALGSVRENLLSSVEELAQLQWIEDEEYTGNVSPWTVSFLRSAIDGNFVAAKASDYVGSE